MYLKIVDNHALSCNRNNVLIYLLPLNHLYCFMKALTDNILFDSLQEVLEVTPNAIGFFDQEFKLIYCNDVMASLFGKTKEAAIGASQKTLLKDAFELSKGIKIITENFESWFDELDKTQRCILYNQFEADTNEGCFFKVTRMTLSTGVTVIAGTDITELKKTKSL